MHFDKFCPIFWQWFTFKLLVSTNFRTVLLDLHTHTYQTWSGLYLYLLLFGFAFVYISYVFLLLCFDNTLFFGIKRVRFGILLKTLSKYLLDKVNLSQDCKIKICTNFTNTLDIDKCSWYLFRWFANLTKFQILKYIQICICYCLLSAPQNQFKTEKNREFIFSVKKK